MTLSKAKTWEVIREMVRAEAALDTLTNDPAFFNTIGRKSSVYTSLMHTRAMLLAHLNVWRQMGGELPETEEKNGHTLF